MGRSALSINEKSQRSKLVRQPLGELTDEKNVSIRQLETYGAMEDKALARVIKKNAKGAELAAEEARREFSRLRIKYRK